MNRKIQSADAISALKEKMLPILKKHGVKKAGIFGSIARGENKKKSDVDVLIKFRNPHSKSLFDLVGVKHELEEKLRKKVDVVEYHTIRTELKKQILGEEVKIL